MWLSTRFLVSVAALSWAVLAFCPAKAPDHDPLPGAVPGFSASAPLVQQDERPVGKNQSRPPAPRTRRQLSLSAYNNPEHGVAFRYPRQYALEEGDVHEHSYFLKRQQDLSVEEPGATLVATVLIPEDAYPNTTFEHGSLQLVTNPSLTEESCGQPSGFADTDAREIKGISASGLEFQGTETRSDIAGSLVLERDYVGILKGACYEFSLVVVSGESSGESARQADSKTIMGQL